ncbi:MAG: iron hydrogenase, partial [Candidatus Methanomethylicota archaeon]
MVKLNEVLSELEKLLSPNFKIVRSDMDGKHVYIETSVDKLIDAAKYLLSIDGRLVHITASDEGYKGLKLIHIYGLDHMDVNSHIILQTHLPRENAVAPSISKLTYQVSWAERETMELLGIKFDGHPDPRHIFLPYEWPDPVESKAEEWKPVKVEGKCILPIGPYHPAMLEGGYFKVKVDGEEVIDVDIKVGFNHRGIMRLAEKRSFWRDIFLVSRICGICNTPHALTFVMAAEAIANITPSDRAQYIRTLLAELNRIHSHLLWLGVAGDLIGFKTLLMWTWKIREDIQDCIELLTGNRVHMDAIIIGGVRRDVNDQQIRKVEEKLRNVKREVGKLADIVVSHNIVRARTEDIGILSLQDAKNGGAVGPTARASGWKIDVRKDSPYAAYSEEYTTWDIVVDEGKDVFARVIVRVKEILVSIDICLQCLDALKRVSGPIKVEVKEFPEGEAIRKSEAPRGELFYYIDSNGTNIPKT